MGFSPYFLQITGNDHLIARGRFSVKYLKINVLVYCIYTYPSITLKQI